MEGKDWLPVLEGILFAMGDSVETAKLAAALELPEDTVKELLKELGQRYQTENRGIQLLFLEDSVQLCTRPEYYEYLIRIAVQPKKHILSESMLETLSIVAYKQPVTRAEIERIRGVKSEHPINKLIEYDLIEEAGRLDAPGRPILFATTEAFLRCFGVSSLMELPEADQKSLAAFKEEAQEEIAVTP